MCQRHPNRYHPYVRTSEEPLPITNSSSTSNDENDNKTSTQNTKDQETAGTSSSGLPAPEREPNAESPTPQTSQDNVPEAQPAIQGNELQLCPASDSDEELRSRDSDVVSDTSFSSWTTESPNPPMRGLDYDFDSSSSSDWETLIVDIDLIMQREGKPNHICRNRRSHH